MASTLWRHNYKRTIRGRATVLYGNAKKRCKQKGVELHITQEWIEKHLKRGTCEITGIPFSFEPPTNEATRRPDAPSLDRIDKNKNYTEDNTRVILWAVNCALAEYGTETMLPILKAMVKGIEDAKQNQPTPISTGSHQESQDNSAHGLVYGTRTWKNRNGTHDYSRQLQGELFDSSPEESSGIGMGSGVPKMGAFETPQSSEGDGDSKTKTDLIREYVEYICSQSRKLGMAVRAEQKVRLPDYRRIKSFQGFKHKKVQSIKEALKVFQAKVDINWDAVSSRLTRSVEPGRYTGLGGTSGDEPNKV
jgi:hypothetical protein